VDRVVVRYPLERGDLRLRTELDWGRDVEPVAADPAAGTHEFAVSTERPFVYFKPVLHDDTGAHWARGENSLLLAGRARTCEVFPYFFEAPHCSECELARRTSSEPGRAHRFRVFLPPGYHENTLLRHPVAFMHDGQNLFFPEEAFGGSHWRVAETLRLLDSMNLIRKVIVVGVYPQERMRDYTSPGYEDYGRYVVEDLKAWIDATYRTLQDPQDTAVIGSSLGGVASLHLAWRWPGAFGNAACLSSTFGWRDDLFDRVTQGPRRAVRIYLDSGWPGDNYEVTLRMRDLLLGVGYRPGRDLFHLAYPEARHDERSWATRLHVPLQHFFGSAERGPIA
jgi:predicted alpha/beta superfamily hydrolase